ncbi:MAG TPA: winged helix DNA-binding domain-containing protein [Microbacterium sp.]|nr:winged helix DNA-binding domain-containing protein [Microbacterium sp.]
MDAAARHLDRLRSERLRSHRLSAPAPSVTEAAAHLLATQAQEFWGGRWALAQRTRGAPALSRVDAAFESGDLVRTWTMRGTLHIVPAADAGWMLGVTAERQLRQASRILRGEWIDDDALLRAERIVRAALRGGGRLTRREFADVLDAGGVPTAGQRVYHLIVALALRGVLCWGPVVPRDGAPTREQWLVLCDEWITGSAAPQDPLAELFRRYIAGHGPAGIRDFAWWTGLPLTISRQVAEAASDSLVEVGEGVFASPSRPRRSPHAPEVVALPPFDEYYISYADRSVACDPAFLAAVGPGVNGMVKAVLLARGEVVGTWTHSLAVGRHSDAPVPELLAPGAATDAEVAAALDRYAAFITG